MSSLESSGFPPPPSQPADGDETGAVQPFASLQPLEELQPLQPLGAPAVESYSVAQRSEPVELQPLEPLQQPSSLEPLQPTMPPPLPLLTAAEPAAPEVPAPPAAPPPSPQEVANLGVPLGTLIFRAGLLTEEQLEDALQEGVRSGKRLGEVLLESGLLDERDLGRLLADQKGLRFVELASLTIDPAATALLSAEKAHMFAALPVGFEDGVPLVAVADPSNELVTENLRRALGNDPRLVVASRSDLHSTIDHVHGAVVEEPAPAPEVEVEHAPAPEAAPVPMPELVQPEPAAAPVVVPEPVAVEAPTPEPAPVEVTPVVAPVAEPVVPVPVVAEPEPAPVELPPLVASTPPAPAPTTEPEPAPVPELKPVEVAHVAPTPVAEPVVTAPEPVLEAAPAPEPVYSQVEPEPEPELEVGAEEDLPTAVSYDVSLRLSDGERVAVGSFGDPQKAREYAREVVRHLSEEGEGWPFFSGRFLRPDTIVSVDIVPVGEPDRWLGSSIRSNWASRLNR